MIEKIIVTFVPIFVIIFTFYLKYNFIKLYEKDIHKESGSVVIQQDEINNTLTKSINFKLKYKEIPKVMIYPEYYNGSWISTIKIDNLTKQGFDIFVNGRYKNKNSLPIRWEVI